jgi:sulfur-oxidizing protein SoxY
VTETDVATHLPTRIDRRHCLWLGAGLGASVWVRPAHADAASLQAAILAFTGGQTPRTGRVQLEVAELVDNGNAVPLTVSVDSPMSEVDHVQRIAVFNELNPQREVITATLGPLAGVARVSTRIRLATSQQLVAVARMSDGSHWAHRVDVIVTLAASLES